MWIKHKSQNGIVKLINLNEIREIKTYTGNDCIQLEFLFRNSDQVEFFSFKSKEERDKALSFIEKQLLDSFVNIDDIVINN